MTGAQFEIRIDGTPHRPLPFKHPGDRVMELASPRSIRHNSRSSW